MKAELTGGHHSDNKHQYMDTLTLYLFTYHYALILTEYMSEDESVTPPSRLTAAVVSAVGGQKLSMCVLVEGLIHGDEWSR